MGAVVTDGDSGPTPEAIHEQWAKIIEMKDAREFRDAMEALGPMVEAFKTKPDKTESENIESGRDAVAAVFKKMPGAFNAEKAGGVEVVFQYEIAGEGGGSWFIAIANGVCRVEKGEHASPTTTILMGAADFLALMNKEANAMALYTSGQVEDQRRSDEIPAYRKAVHVLDLTKEDYGYDRYYFLRRLHSTTSSEPHEHLRKYGLVRTCDRDGCPRGTIFLQLG